MKNDISVQHVRCTIIELDHCGHSTTKVETAPVLFMRPKKATPTKGKKSARQPYKRHVAIDVLREDQVVYGNAPSNHGHSDDTSNLTTIDLFCGAGGITEGFLRAGFKCLYANDANPWAIKTFQANHPGTIADGRKIEEVDARDIREKLKIKRGELDVLVGGPPCQGFSINAPERFLEDPRNSLFRHYIRFIDEFEPKNLVF
jgi:hypothetical protein